MNNILNNNLEARKDQFLEMYNFSRLNYETCMKDGSEEKCEKLKCALKHDSMHLSKELDVISNIMSNKTEKKMRILTDQLYVTRNEIGSLGDTRDYNNSARIKDYLSLGWIIVTTFFIYAICFFF